VITAMRPAAPEARQAAPVPLLEVRNLMKYFAPRGQRFARDLRHVKGAVKAVDDISVDVYRGETLALVGESGCGKSTTGETILYLQRPTSGDIRFDGTSLGGLSGGQLRRLRPRMQMVFQNPYSSLNPRMKVGDILAEPLRTHGRAGTSIRSEVGQLLEMVQLEPSMQDRYPHEFSGGQRQRIGIARALALRPDLIVLDEPVSALDVSVQAQICNLLRDLQKQLGLTYLFISHDLRVVRYMSDRVAVMYLGRIVEIGPTEEIYGEPKHPYTRALYSAVPRAHPLVRRRARMILEGEIPSASDVPAGCRFHTRCFMAVAACRTTDQTLLPVSDGRSVACMRVDFTGSADLSETRVVLQPERPAVSD
jgi:oligopeptide/dipeptide ABC transporter ATP-binding protein